MKKKNLKILIITAFPFLISFIFTSCKEKDRLTTSTFAFTIEPPVASLPSAGNQQVFTIYSSVDVMPTWQVEPVDAGDFSPSVGTVVTFTVQNPAVPIATITVTANGALAVAQVRIAGPPPAPPPDNLFVVYRDGFLANPFRADIFVGGSMGIVENSDGNTVEGIKYQHITAATVSSFWGVTVDRAPSDGTRADLSNFAAGKLKFALKLGRIYDTAAGDFIKVEITAGARPFVRLHDFINKTNLDWQTVEIPLSRFTGVDLTRVEVPFAMSISRIVGSIDYDIDDIRWEK